MWYHQRTSDDRKRDSRWVNRECKFEIKVVLKCRLVEPYF